MLRQPFTLLIIFFCSPAFGNKILEKKKQQRLNLMRCFSWFHFYRSCWVHWSNISVGLQRKHLQNERTYKHKLHIQIVRSTEFLKKFRLHFNLLCKVGKHFAIRISLKNITSNDEWARAGESVRKTLEIAICNPAGINGTGYLILNICIHIHKS